MAQWTPWPQAAYFDILTKYSSSYVQVPVVQMSIYHFLLTVCRMKPTPGAGDQIKVPKWSKNSITIPIWWKLHCSLTLVLKYRFKHLYGNDSCVNVAYTKLSNDIITRSGLTAKRNVHRIPFCMENALAKWVQVMWNIACCRGYRHRANDKSTDFLAEGFKSFHELVWVKTHKGTWRHWATTTCLGLIDTASSGVLRGILWICLLKQGLFRP